MISLGLLSNFRLLILLLLKLFENLFIFFIFFNFDNIEIFLLSIYVIHFFLKQFLQLVTFPIMDINLTGNLFLFSFQLWCFFSISFQFFKKLAEVLYANLQLVLQEIAFIRLLGAFCEK